jgi:hypothetical protein
LNIVLIQYSNGQLLTLRLRKPDQKNEFYAPFTFTASCGFGQHGRSEPIPAPLLVLYALNNTLPLLLALLPLGVLFSKILDDEAKIEVL